MRCYEKYEMEHLEYVVNRYPYIVNRYLEGRILNEVESARELAHIRDLRLMALSPILPRSLKTILSRKEWTEEVRNIFPKQLIRDPSDEELRECYLIICQILDIKRYKEVTPTPFESSLSAHIKSVTNKEFMVGPWIGNHTVDVLFPRLSTEDGTRIIGVEVNGGVHESQPKMNKDNHKYNEFAEAGIVLMTINNEDIFGFLANEFVNKISTMKSTSSYTSKRIMRQIYWLTILTQAHDSLLESLTGFNMAKWKVRHEPQERKYWH